MMTSGYIVHFVLSDNQHRPAIVIKTNDDQTCNLVVFMDGQNDLPSGDNNRNTQWQKSIRHSEEKEPGTWHWIEQV